MEAPEELLYTDADLWVRVDGDIATIGVTDFAQDQLGEVVYVELPEPAATVRAGEGPPVASTLDHIVAAVGG